MDLSGSKLGLGRVQVVVRDMLAGWQVGVLGRLLRWLLIEMFLEILMDLVERRFITSSSLSLCTLSGLLFGIWVVRSSSAFHRMAAGIHPKE
jgi:hypothetical protein